MGGGQSGAARRVLPRQTDLRAVGRDQPELTRALLDTAGRLQRRDLDLELAKDDLHVGALAVEALELVGKVHLLDAQPDDGEAADDEERRHDEAGDERASHAGILLMMQSLLFRHGSRSSTRSFALRARGLARTSSSPGWRGDGSSAANPAPSSVRNVCFTMRSSPE